MKNALLKTKTAKAAGIVALALVAIAGVVTGREKPALELIEPKAAKTETNAVAAADLDLEKLQRNAAAPTGADPFAPRSFAPAVRQAARAASAPAEPTAPPLPFAYLGRLTQDGKTEVYVLRGDELISVAAGQKIDEQYRVEALSESSIVFTYLPLKTRQSIELVQAGG
jgi:hypothetical protein